jgi:type II secretory ATPase GspE/PulE/Tfp pilus assembly ATPase PilB-like protein
MEDFAELSDFEIKPRAVRMLPRRFCERHQVVVLGDMPKAPDKPVTVGMRDPDDSSVRLQIADILQRRIDVKKLNDFEIDEAIEEGFGTDDDEDTLVVRDLSEREDVSTAQEFFEKIVSHAVRDGASDIHIESFREDVDMRLRIDGILHQVFTDLSPRNIEGFINRIKVLSDLDITERRKPQDGRISCVVQLEEREAEIDLRISIVPAPAGEDVVMRILDPEMGLMPISELGMRAETEREFLRLLNNPEGLILVTGPTGSGKTTTLYAALREINDGRRKIITAEDPIEYDVDKICQKEVSEQMPLPLLLRALLRQDPDVMLIGEIRDQVTGDTALAAANTGHVVFGTVHTPDAIGTLTRLRGLGLDDAELSDAMLAVVSQRLVRRVCLACRDNGEPTDEQRELFGGLVEDEVPRPVGCKECRHTGYDDRVGLFELLVIDRHIQEMIYEGAAAGQIREYATSKGHRNLLADAVDKVDAGLTTLDEIERIIPYRQILSARE